MTLHIKFGVVEWILHLTDAMASLVCGVTSSHNRHMSNVDDYILEKMLLNNIVHIVSDQCTFFALKKNTLIFALKIS